MNKLVVYSSKFFDVLFNYFLFNVNQSLYTLTEINYILVNIKLFKKYKNS
jgi:hypothetical protein